MVGGFIISNAEAATSLHLRLDLMEMDSS